MIRVLRESHRAPASVQRRLRLAGGINRYGEPNYRAVWGWDRLGWIGGKWTDGEKIRAIREGVDRNGRALFPMMPYTEYRRMSDEDVQAVVAFLNSLPPVRNALPTTRLNFPVNIMVKFAPQPAGTVPAPASSRKVQRVVALPSCVVNSTYTKSRLEPALQVSASGLRTDTLFSSASGVPATFTEPSCAGAFAFTLNARSMPPDALSV